MEDNMKMAVLGEVAEISMGQSPEGNTYNHIGLGIPLLNGPTDFGISCPVPTVWTTAPTKFCDPDDLLFCVRGSTTGRMNWADQRYCLGRGVAGIRARSGSIDTRFIYYFLLNELDRLLSLCAGSVFPNLSRSDFENFEILWPSEPIRRSIVQVLGTLDEKIKLNHQMNETLESMARAIFKSWFVDFDPVRAKLEDRTPLGMNDETAAMFPSSFENSAIGKVPTGWKVSSIGEIIELTYGKALKEEARYSGSIPVYGSNGQVGWHNEALVKGPGIVVGRKGNPGIVTWVAKDFFPIDTTFYAVPKGPIHAMHYIYYALSLQNLASLAADSAVPGLNRNIAYMTEILVPSVEIANIFDKNVEPFFNRVSMNNEESRTLAAIRDALLSKLLSGEIRVKDAEKYVEALL